MFFKKKLLTMSQDKIKSLTLKPIKYASMRDSETYTETKLGDEGAINIINGEFVLVCSGKNIMRADLNKVYVSELMNLSGVVIKGKNLDTGKEMNITAYFSDGTVKVK